MVERPDDRPRNGSVVDIIDRKGAWVGRGLYNSHSRISLRVLTTNPDEPIDAAFFQRRLERAISLRRDSLRLDEVTDSYRLVHSEGDELSGLVIDKFGSTIVIEFFSSGMHKFRDTIIEVLKIWYPEANYYWFAETHVQKQESFDCRPPEPPAGAWIVEHGLKFKVTPGLKHKTGFFVDQRVNRLELSKMTQGKRVLDLCCNSGGFGVYAGSKGEAAEVTGVDLDDEVLKLAELNSRENGAKVTFVQADIFVWLRDQHRAGQFWDVVVLDPSKQTRDREAIEDALKRYYDMNSLAMQVVKPGGVLLTCSCTGLIKEEDFLETIRRSAWRIGRTAQIFRISGAAEDHPWMVHVQEGRYLKAVWARIF